MLHLKLPTDPRWVNIAERNLEEILVDHAYCEQKAATTCISLIVNHAPNARLVEVVAPIVAEEWEHFQRVLAQLKKRGFQLGIARKDEYVEQLLKHVTKGNSENVRLVDRLLVCALIEARSCERFKLLWQNLEEVELKDFYYELMTSEAGHYVTFIELAREMMPREKVDRRWQEFLKIEAQIIEKLEWRSDRIH
ncbi:MAG: tRNA-(ms[2]io[6]A)-hydroxylase [Bacteroidetes bacterium]|nr:MAG: tRNA-(ms[2]io[6]A)-hydroxylase [Bacteroidota bacterium]